MNAAISAYFFSDRNSKKGFYHLLSWTLENQKNQKNGPYEAEFKKHRNL